MHHKKRKQNYMQASKYYQIYRYHTERMQNNMQSQTKQRLTFTTAMTK